MVVEERSYLFTATLQPGLEGSIGFGMHAGYVTVDKKNGRALYYILTEKTWEPETAPLVLWVKCVSGQMCKHSRRCDDCTCAMVFARCFCCCDGTG